MIIKDKTYWVHKTYPSLQGVKRMPLSRIYNIYDEAEIFYIYKIPEDYLVAIALLYGGDNRWKKNVFVLKELSEFRDYEPSMYINKTKSFYEAV